MPAPTGRLSGPRPNEGSPFIPSSSYEEGSRNEFAPRRERHSGRALITQLRACVIPPPRRSVGNVPRASPYAAWPAAHDLAIGAAVVERMGSGFAWLFGRRSYQEMLGHWNEVGGPSKGGSNRTQNTSPPRTPTSTCPPEPRVDASQREVQGGSALDPKVVAATGNRLGDGSRPKVVSSPPPAAAMRAELDCRTDLLGMHVRPGDRAELEASALVAAADDESMLTCACSVALSALAGRERC
jgi:hypothetical protein